ncbi:MAG TPA: hypothetical protein VFV02_08620 [Acidimicrobiales bacterium]|nr:hypothetical protein [Acidimicrobiales bacterium]
MTGAVVLTVLLVIVVAGLSLAMQSQQGIQGPRPTRPQRTPRVPRPPSPPRRIRERQAQPPAQDVPPPPPDPAEADLLRGVGPEILRSGEEAQAKVVSVVDERTIGPVTRSRITVEIDPGDGQPFEVTTRVAFPTPESRAKVKVGGMVTVHYDKDDRSRVVVDVPAD